MSDKLERHPHAAGEPAASRRARHPLTLGAWGIMLVLLGLLLFDFRDVLLAGMRQRQALGHVKPGERITQAERALNAAGYHTRYYDGPPAMIEVSLLKNMPFLSRTICKAAPESTVDRWIEHHIAEATHFMLMADETGVVRLDESGKPDVYHFETGMHPDLRYKY